MSPGRYEYSPMGYGGNGQMGCDFRVCTNPVVSWVRVDLKDQGNGGVRETLHLLVCADHLNIGIPEQRQWFDDE